MEELLTPAEAARIAGVSYPTLKQWIYKGKVHSVKTAGGHHRVARSEIERISGHTRPHCAELGHPHVHVFYIFDDPSMNFGSSRTCGG